MGHCSVNTGVRVAGMLLLVLNTFFPVMLPLLAALDLSRSGVFSNFH